jgi:hypothetical protein
LLINEVLDNEDICDYVPKLKFMYQKSNVKQGTRADNGLSESSDSTQANKYLLKN